MGGTGVDLYVEEGIRVGCALTKLAQNLGLFPLRVKVPHKISAKSRTFSVTRHFAATKKLLSLLKENHNTGTLHLRVRIVTQFPLSRLRVVFLTEQTTENKPYPSPFQYYLFYAFFVHARIH